MAFTSLITHLCSSDVERAIHYIVCPHVGSGHQHLFSRLVEMDAQFVAGIATPKALVRRVSTAREAGIYVVDLTHVARKRRLAQFLQAVETVKDGHRYVLRRASSKHWKVEKTDVVVLCRYAINQRLLGVPPEYDPGKWQEWQA